MTSCMRLIPTLAAAALAAVVVAFPAWAQGRAAADWPCVQRKVPKLSAAQMWDGPSVEGVTSSDPDVRKIVATLASRRTPKDEAVAALKAFAANVPAADRNAKLVAVFAGLLATVNTQRSGVLDGIERFQQRQRLRSGEIEREGARIGKLKEAAADDKSRTELKQATELFDWNVRVFQERQANMPIACEIPVLMEERLFEMAREIRGLMSS